MEHNSSYGNGYHLTKNSYSNLFNLDSLRNFQLPKDEDDPVNYTSSSQDDSSESKDMMIEHANGNRAERPSDSPPEMTLKRKRYQVEAEAGYNSSARRDADSNDEDDIDYDNYISEQHYRNMLGEHVQRYRKARSREAAAAIARLGTSLTKRNTNGKSRKSSHDSQIVVKDEKITHGLEVPASRSLPLDDASHKVTNRNHLDFSVEQVAGLSQSGLLEIADGICYIIPPNYDKLAPTLNLPNLSDVRIDERFLKGRLDLKSLDAMMAADRRYRHQSRGEFSPASRHQSRAGMGEVLPTYESLQGRLKALSASNSIQKFNLKVFDSDLSASPMQQESLGVQRMIMSETGQLQPCYVRIVGKGENFEVIERKLPKKQLIQKDPSVVEREDAERIKKYWVTILKRDLQKHQKTFLFCHKKLATDAKKVAEYCQKEVKARSTRSLKMVKAAAMRTRKLSRDMLVFYKKVDKEQAEIRKKEEKEAAEALKLEEERREAKRQAKKLDFLLKQTELFSHFMQPKVSTQPTEFSQLDAEASIPEAGEAPNADAINVTEEEDKEEAFMQEAAWTAAKNAVDQQKKKTSDFDNECKKFREATAGDGLTLQGMVEGSSDMDLLNPSSMPITSSVQAPKLFNGTLKEYQLKGLQWLVNCYEQGLNGILADEMGLGKTIQAMAFLAHLAEEKNIWGPFLVVAPASVLNNWADEMSRFCPDLKTLPYWGGLQERSILRKNIHPKRLYRREAGFHILITSYQLLVTDEKYFRRVKWQYMVLDEAQAIKSSNSIRWKTLLSFNCRNRLLLTGTPIQNNMAELWALLHFIMPTLFDSHEQFNEWFSKGIENHAEHGGTLNEHQLSRLHAVLKPFMLRRVKKDVITEMTSKKEVTVNCKLSSRQEAFYQAIKNKIPVAELLESNRLSDKKVLNLMNIVIQLRKVCNHPELFERNEGHSFMYFGHSQNSLLPAPFGEMEEIHYAGSRNPISYKIPKLVYRECTESLPVCCSGSPQGFRQKWLDNLLNIFSAENIYASVFPRHAESESTLVRSGSFGFSRLVDLSPAEVAFLAKASDMERLLFSVIKWDRQFLNEITEGFISEEETCLYDQMEEGKVRAVTRMLMLPIHAESSFLRRRLATGPRNAPYEALAVSHQDRFLSEIRCLKSIYSFIPPIRAPPVDSVCTDRVFAYQKSEQLYHPWMKRLLLGFARTSEFNGPARPQSPHHLIQEIDSELPIQQPVLQLTNRIFGSSPPLQSFDLAKMLTDSGKLQTLDILLKRLRAENHRVLLFAQMTKMLNILEDYMNYRKYRYLRLDGSSTIMDRRDMVRDFQNRQDIFVFLLSTRAGGLGINLTAADTVIFYESDWNPTLDLQAMDRAHRLGQTKEVTVYRLICKETVEEKILQRASQKNTVQQLVMTGRQAQSDILAPDDVVSLLLDDVQLEKKIKEQVPVQVKDKQRKKAIRLDAEGDACLEDITLASEKDAEPEIEKSGSKKRKRNAERKAPSKPRNTQKTVKYADASAEMKDPGQLIINGDSKQKGRAGKRTKKSINDGSRPEDPDEQVVEFTEFPAFVNTGANDAKADMEEDYSSHSCSSSR
uniref:Chromatin-remodeling ATPase INO80 n=1 Tax=Microbiota decussata TaxID=13614 RepID=A0A3S6N0J8_9CONI|nr:INO80 [Microbiota decussata]